MITLYGTPKSRSVRATWALEEAGADYRYVSLDLATGEARTPEFLAINPGGKVPALVEDDFILTESAAICTYVGDRFPASGLVPPAGSRERAHYDQWCHFTIGELEQPLWTVAKHRFALPAAWRVEGLEPTALKEFEVAARVLEKGLAGRDFVLGAAFSAADILLAHTLLWARNAGALPASDVLEPYLERAVNRPALTRARQREATAMAP